MTRQEFMDIYNACGFEYAVSELSQGCDEIVNVDTLEGVARDLLSRGYYGDVATICGVLDENSNCFRVAMYRVDFTCGAEPEPIRSIEDIEDLFEEK